MRTITICASIRHMELIRSTLQEMELQRIHGLFPNIDFQPEGSEMSLHEMKMLQDDHFKAIASSDAIYVLNPQGYIGTMVTAEIGFATGKGKAVYYAEKSPEIELQALASGIIPPHRISEFINITD